MLDYCLKKLWLTINIVIGLLKKSVVLTLAAVLFSTEPCQCSTLGVPYNRRSSDVVWFEATNEAVLLCWGDGVISYLEFDTWDAVSSIKLENYTPCRDALFLSIGKTSPFLAVLGLTELNIYDYSTGQKLWSNSIEKYEFRGIGFSKEGKRFYLNNLAEHYILVIDSKSGSAVQKYSHAIRNADYYVTEENRIVALLGSCEKSSGLDTESSSALHVINLSESIKEIGFYNHSKWPHFWQYNYSSLAKPLGVTDILLFRSSQEELIFAVSILSGEVIWQKSIPSEYLFAVTLDRSVQAFWEKGELRIRHLPAKNYVAVKEHDFKVLELSKKTRYNSEVFNRTSDMAFTPNGKYLLCLPQLKILKDDYEQGIRYVGRDSNELTVIDCKTGKTLTTIDLGKLRKTGTATNRGNRGIK